MGAYQSLVSSVKRIEQPTVWLYIEQADDEPFIQLVKNDWLNYTLTFVTVHGQSTTLELNQSAQCMVEVVLEYSKALLAKFPSKTIRVHCNYMPCVYPSKFGIEDVESSLETCLRFVILTMGTRVDNVTVH